MKRRLTTKRGMDVCERHDATSQRDRRGTKLAAIVSCEICLVIGAGGMVGLGSWRAMIARAQQYKTEKWQQSLLSDVGYISAG